MGVSPHRVWLVLVVLLFGGFFLRQTAGSQRSSPAASQVSSSNDDAEQARLLSLGKKLFLTRCASCHNGRGNKPLSSGPPLNERKLTEEVISRNVSGRFKTASDDDRRAVALYMQSFLKK